MLQVEKQLKHSTHSHPWFPKLAFAILEVCLWKLISSSITNKHNKSNRIKVIQSQIRLLLVSVLPNHDKTKTKTKTP